MRSTQILAFLLLTLTLCAGCQTKAKQLAPAPHAISNGDYVGLEPMASQSPEKPDALWYYENTIVMRNGELILDKAPIWIQNEKKGYSAADGGFISYRGRLLTKKGRLYVGLRPYASDYIGFPVGPDQCEPYSKIDIFPAKKTEAGFWISGVFYKKQTVEAQQLKYWENTLNSEPYQYDGKHPYNSKFKMKACQVYDLSVLDD